MAGYKDDMIFLLSNEEYERYKSMIPSVYCWWWLRSPGLYSDYAACVNDFGDVNYNGDYVYNVISAIRPALRIGDLESSGLEVGKRFIKYEFPWVYLGDNIAIAEVPIEFYVFDYESNDYETSGIRQFLEDWLNNRTTK